MLYQIKFSENLCFHSAVTMSALFWLGPKAAPLAVTSVESLCWPGLPGERNACAQPKYKLSKGVNSWLTTSQVPHRCTLVLECQIRRDRAMHVFDDAANRGLGCELIHDPGLGGVLIRNILSALLLCKPAVNGSRGREKRRAVLRRKGERNTICARKVALPIDTLVPFTGGGHIERAVCVAEIGAHRIVERAVATRYERISAAGRIVAAGAIGFTRREIAAVIVAVLAR